jgi:hypothetical protein
MIWTLTFQDVKTIPLRMVTIGRNMWGEILMVSCSVVYYVVSYWIRFNNIITNLKFLHVEIVLTISDIWPKICRGADKSLARPGRKQATATEEFDFHISYL